MLKSERIRQQIYQRGYEQGCREARLNFEKTAYIERMRDAFKRGEDFSEPPRGSLKRRLSKPVRCAPKKSNRRPGFADIAGMSLLMYKSSGCK